MVPHAPGPQPLSTCTSITYTGLPWLLRLLARTIIGAVERPLGLITAACHRPAAHEHAGQHDRRAGESLGAERLAE